MQQQMSVETMQRSMVVIIAALLIGMVVFAVVALFVPVNMAAGSGQPTAPAPQPPGTVPANAATVDMAKILLPISIVMSVASIVAYLVMGVLERKQATEAWAAREGDEDGRARIVQIFLQFTIQRAAVVEGSGLLAAVGLLLTKELLFLGPIGLAAVLLVTLLPVRSRFEKLLQRASGTSIFPDGVA